jgi:hypothetical protein
MSMALTTSTAGGAIPPEQSAVRKMMWRLVPLFAVMFFINYMDRTNISIAALKMNDDIGLSAAAYGFAAGLFSIPSAARGGVEPGDQVPLIVLGVALLGNALLILAWASGTATPCACSRLPFASTTVAEANTAPE